MAKNRFVASTALTGLLGLGLIAIAPVGAAHAQQTPDQGDRDTTLEVEEIVVTGSYIQRRSDVSQASPITSIGIADLNNIGAADIADLTQTLTINTGSQNNPDAFTQNFSTGTSNINLRGLGVSSTLVLLNGRRQVVSGAATDNGVNFVDTASLVPLIAIERLEILKDGAATLYGADAVAGVANFLTRDGFEGLEVRGEFQTIADTGSSSDARIEVLGGVQMDRGYAIAAVSYLDRTPLTMQEKRLSPLFGPDLSSIGDPGTYLPLGQIPLDVSLADVYTQFAGIPTAEGTPLEAIRAGLSAAGELPAFADPACGSTPNSQAPGAVPALGLPAGVVGICQFDFGEFYNLVPEESRLQGFAKAGYDITDNLSFFAEFGFARNRAERGNTPTFPILTAQLIGGETGPTGLPAHPSNPFGVDLISLFRPIGTGEAVNSTHDSDTYRFSGGFDWRINDTWRLNTSVTAATNEFRVSVQDTLRNEMAFALAGLGGENCDPLTGTPGEGPCFFFDPFGPGQASPLNTEEVLDYVIDRNRLDFDSDLLVVDAVIAGDLGDRLALPGGPIGVAVGGQYRGERYGLDADTNSNNGNFLFASGAGTAVPDFRGERDTYAVFGEVRLPATDWMEVNASVRYEDIQGVGDSVDPKVGVLIMPHDDLSLRGTFSTSFRAPSIFQQETGGFVALAQLRDPLVGNTAFLAEFTTGNPDLNPEDSRQFNVGATYQPGAVPGLSLSLDYWNFDFDDKITKENAQALLDEAERQAAQVGNPTPLLNPDRFVRPALQFGLPLLSQVNTQFVNAPSIETAGLDFSASYQFDTAIGTFRPSFEGTLITKYDITDPTLGVIDGKGNRNFTNVGNPTPPLRFNLGLNWTQGAHAFNVYGRYIDGFDDDQASPTAEPGPDGRVPENGVVSDIFTVDLQYTLQVNQLFDLDESLVFSAGAINVAGTEPPFVNTNGGYESRVHDPRGRVVYVRLTASF
ncbi:TonB-dependent receptor-like protein [Rhodothalassium salexigens DSM 2132]|uniref:TonB-dependent receptor-like protein n=1 Tax=Rhodothalassium salexigens DSM 2132 TaxID=1188247 RepID=A0A4R2P910_RHOSA|nr:TonB-dependent receptor [Rhodothalassium salexigens]MBB4212475.1 outer membrane receptor protein involved in Fe transport [Rhodothalassium salexigens DSM 2132]TCP31483.1 TonB-dependent receptor-like protein [Rhodothalassium salexigens DSM 2132]